MVAEAIINDVPLNGIDVTAVAFYRRYIKSRLLLNSGGYDAHADDVCDMPFCGRPSGKKISWTQCDRCDRWCHDVCVGRSASVVSNAAFICSLC